ncbi:hypothetical protein PF005_g16051 [Phytophthora fragariae]|uniref:RxLR effector protein n=1 Tax=Phytophthora fragariae TaxID=53985 RepID=A0A6A3TAS9_9STRA|nr:hypothetical protein PF003_g18477 [Phytophthora fragariae]KAE8932540.1 hypothetical protein PF009_g17430 [Phytophthora fragariae]KAE8998384.1 hypothetical protein PF011_g15076 [Phytophthora fragariae]KAE9077496.1 hypothetical protein PF010_g23487 [Phytophthora fragariae]KAE9098156.1 hypothetical protein PF007_g16368 [Phytophthora fragariae]
MRFFHAVLVMAIALLTIATTAASTPDHSNRRMLRAIDTNLDERASLIMWAKVRSWARAGKSDAYVKEKLGIAGLRGGVLKSNPNYKHLQKFRYKLEGYTLDDWMEEGLTVHGAWMHLKLNEVPEAALAQSDKFRTYKRYATRWDDMTYAHYNTIFQPPVEYGGSPAELNAKVEIWAAARRPKWYVQDMLNLDKSDELLSYYNKFVELKYPKK